MMISTNPFTILTFFLFGLVFGSFFNVVIYRLPLKKSILYPSSFCPKCGINIKPYDNIPLISYALLRGRCRNCGARIPFRYPFVELLTGVLFCLSLYKNGFNIELVGILLFTSIMIITAFIDLDYMVIPDRITLPGIVVGFAVSLLRGGITPVDSAVGLVAGGGILFLISVLGDWAFKKESMGGGDIKLAALIGAFIGWKGVLVTLILSSFLGASVGILMLLFSRTFSKRENHQIPFGPFLSLASIIALYWGNEIIRIYIQNVIK